MSTANVTHLAADMYTSKPRKIQSCSVMGACRAILMCNRNPRDLPNQLATWILFTYGNGDFDAHYLEHKDLALNYVCYYRAPHIA